MGIRIRTMGDPVDCMQVSSMLYLNVSGSHNRL